VSTISQPPPRLTRLLQILTQSRPVSAQSGPESPDAADVHLASVPLERIGQITRELENRAGEETDEIDALAMRLLLNDYVIAVAHLRAVARLAEQCVDAAWTPVDDARSLVRRHLKREHKPYKQI
jgi:hypothetical protein